MGIMQAAIFLDRDGVINRNRADHVKSWAEFEFLPGVLLALRELAQLERPLVVISNQAAIGRGLVNIQTVEDIHHRMAMMVEKVGGRIDEVLYCPHRPEDMCNCRKPNPGMLLRAAQDMDLDLTCSFLVGDALTDIAAAKSVGAQPVLVKTGRGDDQLTRYGAQSFEGVYIAADLLSAASWITQQVAVRKTGQSPQLPLQWNDSETMRQHVTVKE
jgi:D-glycero-D-manno-heptose 1,7-bisphosphate phosphatase